MKEEYKPNYELLKKRDEGEWERLDTTMRPRLLGVVMKMGLGPQDAEDAVQDTFIKFATHIDEVDEDRSPRGYLFQAAKNRAIDYFRVQKKRPTDVLDEERDFEDKVDVAGEVQMKLDLEYALGGLSETHRTILTMIPNYSFNEIAAFIHMPRGSLGRHVTMARQEAQGKLT